jgi:hypothetical protein
VGGGSLMDVKIDFREEVPDMIKDFGFDLLIQRASSIFPCSCAYGSKEQLYNNADKFCRLCNNSGKVIKLEKQKSLKCEHDPKIFDFTALGIDNTQINDFYFDYFVSVQEDDFIYEVGWEDVVVSRGNRQGDRPGDCPGPKKIDQIPVSLHNIYRVKNPIYTKGSGGRIDYLLVLCQKQNRSLHLAQQKFIRNFKYYNRNFFLRGGVL